MVKRLRKCLFCKREFEPRHHLQVCCSADCARQRRNEQERIRYQARHGETVARRRQAAVRSSGLTLAAAAEIDRLQDAGDAEALRKAAAKWSKAERAYAKRRYESQNRLFAPWN